MIHKFRWRLSLYLQGFSWREAGRLVDLNWCWMAVQEPTWYDY